MKKLYISDTQVKKYTSDIIRQLTLKNWRPDLVLGPARGGIVPANYISQYYDIPCYIINKGAGIILPQIFPHIKILFIDDINDTGSSSHKIKQDLDSRYAKLNVKYCYLIDNESSTFTADFSGLTINKLEDPCWVIFPWENWWETW